MTHLEEEVKRSYFNEEKKNMIGHADTIQQAKDVLSGEPGARYMGVDRELARQYLALVAENQQQAEQIAQLQAMVDDLFERNGWIKIGWERPPEHVFAMFRKLHGIEGA